nr:MAG TPA: hypothetical protein [Caudoviricetes sp.]
MVCQHSRGRVREKARAVYQSGGAQCRKHTLPVCRAIR